MSLPAFPSTGLPLQSFASLCAASLLTVSALCPGTARAQAGAACDPQSTAVASLNACAVQHFQEVDTAQNILYADVMRALSAHERPALRQDHAQVCGVPLTAPDVWRTLGLLQRRDRVLGPVAQALRECLVQVQGVGG